MTCKFEIHLNKKKNSIVKSLDPQLKHFFGFGFGIWYEEACHVISIFIIF